ncbi:MAG: NAD(P)-dependent alcohol dehydrogenase [Pirellulales bacterium]|nr:NAD(P)-dependent alcohol dehydrogenase [Pirellulales bacterium]
MKAFELAQFGLDQLKLVEREPPRPGPREVVVKLRAASLNYRDLMFCRGVYNPKAKLPAVPLSDGAGEVVEAGPEVTRWKVGNRVCPIFNQGWIDGGYSADKAGATLGGGDLDGVLRELAAFDEQGLVAVPDRLSYEEAATLPCAAVTAWHALIVSGRVHAGQTVLTLGAGGVSVFALQFAKLHGARVIATSSSDEKLARMRQLGADETLNYRACPDWEREVRRLTDGRGVEHVVEVGGAGTLAKSVAATSAGGHIAVIGVLSQGPGLDPIPLLMKGLRLQGIFVGSRRMFEDMRSAISQGGLRPAIDQIFPFMDIQAALRHMERGSHFGKIVIGF